MQNEINWEQRFGKPPEDWSTREFRMAVFSTLNQQNANIGLLTKTVSALPCASNTAKLKRMEALMEKIDKGELDTKAETVKGKFSLKASAISGGFIILGAIITIAMNYFLG